MDTNDPTMLERLRSGRARLRMRDAEGAIADWKEAMALAYSAQRYSIAFVLSKNLGDALVKTAKTESTPALYVEKLREAREYFAYALAIVKTCALEDAIACQPALRQCVDYIERRHRRIERSIHKAARRAVAPSFQLAHTEEEEEEEEEAEAEEEQPVPSTFDDGVEPTENVCTTCETNATTENPIIMDEADGCWYCKSCFDDYYQDCTATTSLDTEEPKHIEESNNDTVENCCTDVEERVLAHAQVDVEAEAEAEVEAVDSIDVEDELAVDENSERLAITTEENSVQSDHAVVETNATEAEAPSNEDMPVSASPEDTSERARLVYDIEFLRSLRHRGVSESPDIARVASLCSSLITIPVTPRKPATKAKKKSKTRAPTSRASQPPTASSSPSITESLLPTLDQVESLQTLSLPPASADEWAVELFSDTFTQQVSIMQSVARE
ncbi:hypothetical protein PINS_up008305 [Pythium insidiosum]|nr:hypothetical protein PINS_up008305 [Pythium insidiosum]